MARGASRLPVPLPEAPNSLIASAVRLARNATSPGHPGRPTTAGLEEWQEEAWYFFDTCGELAFAATWFANAMSRVRLYPQMTTADGGEEEISAGPPVDAMDALMGGPAGQSTMLGGLGLHLFVPGECYIVGEQTEEGDTWTLYSNAEVKPQGASGTYIIDRGDADRRTITTDPDAEQPAVVIRVWRSHPRLWAEATSPCRAVLPILRELEQLTKSIGASLDSRLAGAGVLALPTEMTFGTPPAPHDQPTDGEQPASDAQTDQFIADLAEAMLTPIKDRGNAAAVVPIVVRAPGALIGNIQHLSFATPLDEKAIDLRGEAIRRLALGLDMPPEVLLGTGDVNHWGAWQIEEAALKTHIEPLCELITSALSTNYLLPVLEAQGYPVDYIEVGYDTSDLRLRPNRSAEAFQMYDRMEIDGEALRRETGFEEGDAPDPDELDQMILGKVALSQSTPDMAAAALAELGIPLTPQQAVVPEEARHPEVVTTPAEPPQAPDDNADGTTGPPPVPTDTNPIPQPAPAAALEAVLAGAWPLAHRAVERARNRFGARSKTVRPIPPERLDECLHNAVDDQLTSQVAGLLHIDADLFAAAIDGYVRDRLLTGAPHDPRLLLRRVRAAKARSSLKVVASG